MSVRTRSVVRGAVLMAYLEDLWSSQGKTPKTKITVLCLGCDPEGAFSASQS